MTSYTVPYSVEGVDVDSVWPPLLYLSVEGVDVDGVWPPILYLSVEGVDVDGVWPHILYLSVEGVDVDGIWPPGLQLAQHEARLARAPVQDYLVFFYTHTSTQYLQVFQGLGNIAQPTIIFAAFNFSILYCTICIGRTWQDAADKWNQYIMLWPLPGLLKTQLHSPFNTQLHHSPALTLSYTFPVTLSYTLP